MGTENSTLGRQRNGDIPDISEINSQESLPASLIEQDEDLPSAADSPSSTSPNLRKKGSKMSRKLRDKMSQSTLVMVGKSSDAPINLEDPLLAQLREIQTLYPVMHEAEKGIWIKKRMLEIQSRITAGPLVRIVNLYEDRLRKHAESIAVEQGRLTKCVREIDYALAAMIKSFTERQRKHAKYAEKFGHIKDFSHMLSKCQKVLTESKFTIQLLNDMLSPEERLEPFVW